MYTFFERWDYSELPVFRTQSLVPNRWLMNICSTVNQIPYVSNIINLGGSLVKNPPEKAGDAVSIPGSGRSPGRGHGNSLQYSCLENPKDREAWQTTVLRAAKNQTRLKRLSMHAHMAIHRCHKLWGYMKIGSLLFDPPVRMLGLISHFFI